MGAAVQPNGCPSGDTCVLNIQHNGEQDDMLHKAQAGQTRMPALASCFQDFWRNVKERPVFMLAVPVLTFLVLCSLSVAGVVLGANKFESDQRNAADAAALDWAASFRLSTEKIFTPLVTLAILIQQNPDLQQMRKTFPEIAAKLMEEVNRERLVIQELQITPMGVISIIEPKNNDTDTRIGINLFKQPALRGGALRTIEAREYVTNGPLQLVQGNFGTIARIPIFIQNSTLNETFGTNKTLPDECAICFNATTKEKFWGFATAIGPLDDLRAGNDTRLDLLKQKGYKWLMTRPYTATERNDSKLYRPEWTAADGDYIFANSSSWPSQRKAVSRPIHIGNAQWELYLEPQGGWRPSWEHGAIAAVVLGSAVLALLVATIMALWAQQQRLLGDVLERNTQLAETTAKLQEEKLRLDALLVRQYNLLAILGKQGGSGGRSGRVSKAADVYAFGITLWEMFTGGRAFEGVPRALLGHQITREHKRPRFPDSAPWAYRDLAERCWQPNWQERPTFKQVLRELQALRAADAQPTPALHVVLRPPRVLAGSTPSAKGSDGSPPISSGNQPNGAHSTPITPTLTRLGPAAPVTATGDASYYLEHSSNEDVIVMNSLTDWSMGPGGITQQQQQQQIGRPGGNGGVGNGGGWRGSLRASHCSLLMPQIVEWPGEGHEGGGDSGGAAGQQQQRLDAGRAAAEAQLASLEGQAQPAQLQ